MASATNERAIAAAREQQKKDRATDREVITALMSQPSGRRWVWLRLSEARIFVEDENLDPQFMAYRQGQRNIGLRLLTDVNRFTPEMYVQMTRENTSLPADEKEEDNG